VAAKPRRIAGNLGNLGLVAYSQGNDGGARNLHQQSLAMFQQLGDQVGISRSFIDLGWVVFKQG
jgi:hypothetical protein